MIASWICIAVFLQGPDQGPDQGPHLRSASTHPMRYYLSLPKGWSAAKTWPVVVAIESADCDFKGNAEAFVKARGARPFILVIPEVVTNGGPNFKLAPGYDYGSADWARVDRDGRWKFDDEGLAAVLSDVRQQFGGRAKYYLTGWEAGTHTAFALTFNRPDRIEASAPVCPNYAGRYVSFSNWPGRTDLPIRVFAGSADPAWGPGKPLTVQTALAEKEGGAHGFRFAMQLAPGKGHGPLAEEVLSWFQLLERSEGSRKP